MNRTCSTQPLQRHGGGVETAVHPPDQQLGVELLLARVAEDPAGSPTAQRHQHPLEVAAALGHEVPAADPLHQALPLEGPQPLGQEARSADIGREGSLVMEWEYLLLTATRS
jgi:hypothetical protein